MAEAGPEFSLLKFPGKRGFFFPEIHDIIPKICRFSAFFSLKFLPSADAPGLESYAYKHNQPALDRAGDEAPADGIIEGRNAVIKEALRAGTQIDKIFIMKGEVTPPWVTSPPPPAAGIVVADADKRKLDG